MKWAGPRMAWRHPVLSFYHLLDGRRPSPKLPAKPVKRPGDVATERSGMSMPATGVSHGTRSADPPTAKKP